MKNKRQALKFALIGTVILCGVIGYSSLHATEEAKKDGIKSSTTGNCWDTGTQCVKDPS